jgi:formylmethanofuran dehydrogenase subunit B
MTVDFSSGAPAYRPHADAVSLLANHELDTALIIGSPHAIPDQMKSELSRVACVAIGPRASESPFPTACAIDTGTAGIHERGFAIRMDGIPLPLRPALEPSIVAEFLTNGSASEVTSPLAIADTLAATQRPQDSYLILRALTTLLLPRNAAAPTRMP